MSVTTTSPDAVVPLGGEYSYTATVRNDSTRSAENVWVRSGLPLAARFLSATTDSPGVCYRLKRDISCQLDTLAPGESRSMTITAQALSSGHLRRKAVATTSSPEVRADDNNSSADGTVSEAATATEIFSTGDIAVGIPNPGRVVVPVDVTASPGIALDVNAMIRLRSKNINNLSITLVSPAGRSVPLTSDNGPSSTGTIGSGPFGCAGKLAVFDDRAKASVMDNSEPYTRRPNHPESPLSDVAGDDYDGQWRLVIDGAGRSGEVGCVELQIQHTDD